MLCSGVTTTSVTEILQQSQKSVEEHTDRIKEVGENCVMGSFIIFTSRQILLRWQNQEQRFSRRRDMHEKKINAYGISVCKPEGKRHLERRRRRWEYNIKIDLK